MYSATRDDDPRPFAVKVARRPGDLFGAEQEVQAAARLSHPHIVGVEGWGAVDGRFWVAMPRISGRALNECLLRLMPEARLSVFQQLLDGLAYAHDRGVVHRDLKPEKAMLEVRPNGASHLWLKDFGIAALAPSHTVGVDEAVDERRRGAPGTPTYMAPEQARGQAVGPEADLYAVGVMLFVAFSGRLPFEGPPMKVLIDKASERPPPLRSTPAWPVPPPLARLVEKLLSTHPLDRPPCASAVRAALAEVRFDDGPGTPALADVDAAGSTWGERPTGAHTAHAEATEVEAPPPRPPSRPAAPPPFWTRRWPAPRR